MKISIKRVMRIALGVGCLIMWVVAILPGVPGFWFLPLGLAILSSESKTAKRIDNWLRSRFPRFFRLSDKSIGFVAALVARKRKNAEPPEAGSGPVPPAAASSSSDAA